MTARGAVFLDRDGTIIEDPGYLHDPDRIMLLPGAADGLAALVRAGWPLVIVSNQSGIARGLYHADAFHLTMRRLEELLAPVGVGFLAAYYCPHHPDFSGPCDCRKPGTVLFERAAREHGLDLATSWYVGDRWRDVAPARALGGHALLVGAAAESEDSRLAAAAGFPAVADLREAARHIGPAA